MKLFTRGAALTLVFTFVALLLNACSGSGGDSAPATAHPTEERLGNGTTGERVLEPTGVSNAGAFDTKGVATVLFVDQDG